MKKWIQTVEYKVKRKDVELSIGDYINYHDHAGEGGKDLYKGRWQVLGSDDEGRLLIVSEENVTTQYFNEEKTLEGGMKAYSTGLDTLNRICEIYGKGKGATGARSIQIEDVDRLTGFDKMQYDEYGKSYTLKNKKGNTFIWHDGTKWHKTKTNKSVTLANTFYFYDVQYNNLPSNVYNMLFGKRDKYYWLASVCVYANSYFAYFGLHDVYYGIVDGYEFAGSNDYINFFGSGVRAVIILNSDTIEKRKNEL